MSVISEALKKAQAPSQTGTGLFQRKTLSTKKPLHAKKPAQPKKKFLFFSITALVVAFLIFFANFLSSYFLRQNLAIEEPKAVEAPIALPIYSADLEEEALPAVITPTITANEIRSAVRLTGIMYTPKKPLAVINGAVWKQGERIGKFEILKIEENSLTVGADDQEFVVRLKQ